VINILQKLKGLILGKKKVHIHLDEESVREHNTIRALANQNAELKAESSKLKSDLSKYQEREKDITKDEDVRIELDKRNRELKQKSYPKYTSLKALFSKYLKDKRFRKKLGIYSFNREKKLDKFGDLGFDSQGFIVLLNDKQEVLLRVRNPNELFQSVGALGNDIESGKIPINVTPNGEYVENLMVWEAPELVPTGSGKFKYATAKKKELYKYLNELRDEIGEKIEKIEELELTNTKLQNKVDELKVAQRVAEDSSETSRAELSENETNVSAITKIYRGMERELAKVRDVNSIIEDNLAKLEEQVEILRGEAERRGVKISDDRAMEIIQQIRRELVRDEPEKVVEIRKESK